MNQPLLRRVAPDALDAARSDPLDAATRAAADAIVEDVLARGEPALRAHAERLGDVEPGAALYVDRAGLDAALAELPAADRALLERTAARIRAFAEAQRRALHGLETPIEGGRAGHELAPVEAAGCYAPGGRHPLPSSVLMTAVTARAAGVPQVWVASPRPTAMTRAAAAVAGADGLLAVGGAQAIAALARGVGPVPRCDAIVGPGNRFVTAAKARLSGRVAIDMLAGPSELLVLADASADPALIAADLLAQAEHDPDAMPALVTTDASLPDRVEAALRDQLADLPTAAVARAALARGLCLVVADLDAALDAADRIAAEHLELHLTEAEAARARLRHYGGLFVGAGAAEVLGDYGAGPNHVLPTSGTARAFAGLSVQAFLRQRTWLRIDRPQQSAGLLRDAAALARHEGLEAHARAAERRLSSGARGADASAETGWPIGIEDVRAARHRIHERLGGPTALRRYPGLESWLGGGLECWLKHENHLPTNAFKARNGLSLVSGLSPEARARGLVAATRGNHGQGVAWAGALYGAPVTICVPLGNNPEKNAAMRALGAEVIEQGADYDEAVAVARSIVERDGATLAHSTNDPLVIAGAGTMGLELLEQHAALDAIVVSVGGGSQAVGVATVLRALAPHIELYGVQAAGAPAIHDAWHAGEWRTTERADTIADGLATRTPYALTFDALRAGLTDFLLVDDEEIAAAMRAILEHSHNLVEPAGAAALAGLRRLAPRLAGRRVAVVLSGGNVDRATLRAVLDGHGVVKRG